MDYGSRYADRSQRRIEWRLQRLYREAQKDLEKKFDEFLEKHKAKGQEMWQKLQDGEITLKEYQNWMRGQVFQSKQWQAKINQAATALKHTNEEALSIVRGEQFNTFAENANYEAYEIEKEFRGAYNFNIYDTDAVQNLVQKKPELLPRKTVNGQKDEAWNKRVIANCVAQGIIQGESIDKIARRISRDTASTDMKSMVRYARTATTSAMNAGKLQTMERAQNMGLRIQKQWRANLDSRTRDAHRDLDGQIQELDDPFESELGEIMFPGDPTAAAGNVYNCRCRLRRFYPEYPDTGDRQAYDEWVDEDGEKHRTPYYVPGDMTYRDWEKMKNGRKTPGTASRADEKKEKPLFKEDPKKLWKNTNPGTGTVLELEKPTSPDYKHELLIAKEIRDVIGGDVEMLDQRGNKKVADFRWKDMTWELKSPTSMQAVDGRTHDAIKKAKEIDCQIAIDVLHDDIDQAYEIIQHRVIRSADRNCYILVFHNGKYYKSLKYNKNR